MKLTPEVLRIASFMCATLCLLTFIRGDAIPGSFLLVAAIILSVVGILTDPALRRENVVQEAALTSKDE